MLPTTCAASVLVFRTFVCKVTPAPVLHALDRFLLLLRRSDQATANTKTILDYFIGNVDRHNDQYGISIGLAFSPACYWFDPSCSAYYAHWERVSLLNISEVGQVFWFKG